jgi:hypothetical protein
MTPEILAVIIVSSYYEFALYRFLASTFGINRELKAEGLSCQSGRIQEDVPRGNLKEA